jgi:RNA binding exosome subunit
VVYFDAVSMKGPIQAVEISYFVHSTEDAERIDVTVRTALGIEVMPETQELEGHYGNRILSVRYHLLDEGAANVVEKLAAGLHLADKEELKKAMEGCIDEHSALYLRLDKQLLMNGAIRLATSDPVRIRIKPRLFLLRVGAPSFYRKMMKVDE